MGHAAQCSGHASASILLAGWIHRRHLFLVLSDHSSRREPFWDGEERKKRKKSKMIIIIWSIHYRDV